MKNKIIKAAIFCLVVVIFPLLATAQKLPKIQQGNVRAPANIKIDANTAKWNNKFRAYNTNNRIFYTLSNDDDNLYLTICANDGYAIEKALFGITFTVHLPAMRNVKINHDVVIAFPTNVEVSKKEPIRNTINRIRQLRDDTSSNAKRKIDSLRLFANRRFNNVFKVMNVSGIQGLPDSVLSIYNADGIRVAAQYNEEMHYVYELSIPLKYLNPTIISGQKFKYNIKMNGIPERSPGNSFSLPTLSVESMGPDNTYVLYPTDFSGEYTLAKK